MLVFVATLAVGITITALYISNMYIVVTEGMELRAECILQNGPKLELTKFFTEDYLKQDALLNYNTQEEPLGGNPYEPWTITCLLYTSRSAKSPAQAKAVAPRVGAWIEIR